MINRLPSIKILIDVLIILLLLSSSYSGIAFSNNDHTNTNTLRHIQITVDSADLEAQNLKLQGYDVLTHTIKSSSFDLIVTKQELQSLSAKGYTFEIIDIGRPFFQIQQEQHKGLISVPPGYLDYTEIIDEMQDYANEYPSICKFYDLTQIYNMPETYEGRHLYALKITDNVDMDENEPAFLMVSCHHAREIITPVIALYAIEQFLTQYGSDPTITAIIDEYELWISPVWNPDGYEYMFYVDNMWRKNRQPPHGVDLNRNYPFGWYSGCSGSTNPYSETYKGSSPASESETKTMMAFSDDRHFVKVIDYHSHGSEVLYGYCCHSHPFTSFMQSEAIQLSIAAGYGGNIRPPSAEGEEYEWQIFTNGSYAYLMETHTQFQPSYSSAIAEAAQIFPSTLWMLQRPISLSGVVKDARTNDPLIANLTLQGITFSNNEIFKSEPRFGRYHFIIPPGTYTLNFSTPGYFPQEYTFTVTTTSEEIKDIYLSPPNTAPNIPSINGPNSPGLDKEYTYTFWGNDIDQDELEFFIMWGDGKFQDWTGPYQCNETFQLSHKWNEENQYTIRCKSRDPSGEESDWARFKISVPKNNQYFPYLNMLSNFPRIWKFLSELSFLTTFFNNHHF